MTVLTCFSTCTKMVRCMCPLNTTWSLSNVGLRYFFVSASWRKGPPPKSNREAIIQLNRENLRLYGPLLKTQKNLKTKERTLVDPETKNLDSSSISSSSKQKKKSPIQSNENSRIIIEKSEASTETVKKSKKQSKKTKKSISKLVDFLPADSSPGVRPLEQEACESICDLVLPVNWEELISNFISKQTLTVSDTDFPSNNRDYKNILNLLNVQSLPSVTTILNKTLSPTSRLLLQRWKTRMIREMGSAKFQKYQEELKRNGSNFHLYIQRILSEEHLEENDLHVANEGHWQSLKSLVPLVTNVRALESAVIHQNLLYRGMFDCVANYDNVLCLIDWKTSQKQKPLIANTYDNPVQVVAYISALNTTSLLKDQVTNAVIVVAYPDGSPADVHFMDEKMCRHYWQEWKRRLIEYWTIFKSQKESS